MSGLSRFFGHAGSVLTRGSGVGGRAACQKRGDWSRPAIGSPSDTATQRDIRSNRSAAGLSPVTGSPRRETRAPSSGLNPHPRCPPLPRTVPVGTWATQATARCLQTGHRGRQCWDNALAESFFSSLKGELIDARAWPTRAGARRAVVEYIAWYNGTRLHSSLGYQSPADYENNHHEKVRQVA